MRGRLVVSALLLIAGAAVAFSPPADAAGFAGTSYFVDVTCASASSCFAVGSVFSSNGVTTTLVEHWNGRQWSIMPTPNIATTSSSGGTFLKDVACSSPTSCFAIGYSATRKGNRLPERPFAMHWNGKKWSTVSSATPSGATYADLESVSCVAGNRCFAAGHTQSGGIGNIHPLIEQWNGKAFIRIASPEPAGATDSPLFGVRCRTAADCYAVGRTNAGAIIEHWDGKAWTIAATPNFGVRVPELDSISCPTAKRCVAVGTYYDDRADASALTVVGSGSAWAQTTRDASPANRETWLTDVTCPSTAACVSVGRFGSEEQTSQFTFAEHLVGGTWTRDVTPNPDHRANAANGLTGVACLSAKSCFAVGSSTAAKVTAPIMHWNGKTWTLVANPSPK